MMSGRPGRARSAGVQGIRQGSSGGSRLSAITRPLERLVATAQNGFEVARFGGLETGGCRPRSRSSRAPACWLRRYFPPDSRPGHAKPGPPVLMVHPMMMSANMWDVTREDGAVGILHAAGIDPWVIDYGSPDEVEGGMERTLTDHIVALSQAIETVNSATGQNVHLAGYPRAACSATRPRLYRRSRTSPASWPRFAGWTPWPACPAARPPTFAVGFADFADHVFSHIDIPGWLARTGFQMLDPIKSVRSKVEFLFQLHDREALLPREQQRRFLDREGWIAWSGPAVAELLKQFVAHNRMMTGVSPSRDSW